MQTTKYNLKTQNIKTTKKSKNRSNVFISVEAGKPSPSSGGSDLGATLDWKHWCIAARCWVKISLQDAPSAKVLGPAPAPSWAQESEGEPQGPSSKPAWQQLSAKHTSDLTLLKNLKAKPNYFCMRFKEMMLNPALRQVTQSCWFSA